MGRGDKVDLSSRRQLIQAYRPQRNYEDAIDY